MKTLLSTAATVLFGVYASTAVAGDPERGEKVFKKCKACHAVGDGAKIKLVRSLIISSAMLQALLKATNTPKRSQHNRMQV